MNRTAALALVLAMTAPATAIAADEGAAPTHTPLATAISRAAEDAAPTLPAWAVDRPVARGTLLPALYGTYAAMQILDVVSTKQAIAGGSREQNPLMRSGNTAAMFAVKAAAGAGTIYFAERAWKKNKAGAIVLMAVLNGATAAIAARNFQHARR